MSQEPNNDQKMWQAIRNDVAPEASPAFQFLLDHARTIATVVVLFVVFSGAVLLYKWHVGKGLDKARAEIGAVMVEKSGAGRIAALKGMLPSVPSELVLSVNFKIAFAAEEENDFSSALEAWSTIYATADEPLKTVAGLGKVKNLSALGRSAEALSFLEGLAKTAGKEMLPEVVAELAARAEIAGEFAKSRAAYEQLLTIGDDSEKDFITSRIASLNAKIGESKK